MPQHYIFFSPMSIVLIREFVMDKCHLLEPFCLSSWLGSPRREQHPQSVVAEVARLWTSNPISCEIGYSKTITAARHNTAFRLKLLLLMAVWFFTSPAAYAQRIDSFEGGQVRWELVDSDCQAELTSHEISLIMPHGGSSSELFDVFCGQGSMALLAYPIEPCRILDEFRPAVWTRSSSGRIQLGCRVIFPMAEHPVTQGRLNAVMWGGIYSEPGQWQMLEVSELQKKLTLEMVGLRQRFGAELNLDGAYIDCLVINAYTGPGGCRVQIDDLNLRGLVSMAATGLPPPENWRARWRWRYETTQNPEQRFWEGGNRPTTWLHYQRESLPWIKSLGFTGLVLGELPSEEQLGRIAVSELKAILPMPPHSVTFDRANATAIKGWSIGAALDARQADLARSTAMRVSQLPSELQRPLFGEALEQYWLFSRIADEVITPFPAPATAGGSRDKLAWVARQLQTTGNRGEGWVSIEVGPNPALVDQIRVAHRLIAPRSDFDETQANPLGLRYQVASAVQAGARGFVFRTFKPLEPSTFKGAGDGATLAALRCSHGDLALWGPWIVGGQVSTPPTTNRDDYSATAWSVSHSRLVLALATPVDAQYCLPATAAVPLQCSIASPSTPQQVFRLTDGRLERIDAEMTPAGLRWEVAEPQPIESLIITSNPLVIDFARKQLSRQSDQRAADQLEIVSYNLGLASAMVEARYPVIDGEVSRSVADVSLRRLAVAGRQLEQGYQALQSRQPTAAISLAARASETVQGLLFEAQQVAISNLASPQASPLVVSPVALGYHWGLADACRRSEWKELPIPGANLLSPPELEQLGWSLEQRPLEQVDLQVEFLPQTAEQTSGLRLAAYGRQASSVGSSTTPSSSTKPAMIPGGYEGASSRVRSAAAEVHVGQLVRVAAKARVLTAPTTPDSGLLIYDNQAGPSLGQLVRGAAGELVPIELYRFVVADGEFRVLAECRGQCDIVLEAISTSVIEPAVNRKSFVTSPTGY